MADKNPQPIKRMPAGLMEALNKLADRIKKPRPADILAGRVRKHLRII